MLNSFEIRNFRLFKYLKVEKLGRVNLIVGRNNSGKSTFLEAIKLYASNASPTVLLELIESRQETWFSEAQPNSRNFSDSPVRHLFFGHQLPDLEGEGLVFGEISSNFKLYIKVAAYQIRQEDDEEGIRRIVRISELENNQDLSDIEIFLVAAEEDGKTRRLFRLDRTFKEEKRSRFRVLERQEPESKYTLQIVSTENMSNRKLAALWDLTSLTDLESEVISTLGLVDERVSGIAFVDDISQKILNNNNRIPLVKLNGIDEPFPLKTMGDGMTRLLHIIITLVNARNGILLIDEFENGLHWSIQHRVWDIIFQLSERLNIQVFATTHSRDCVEGFDQIWNNYSNLGAFFRLDAKDEFIKVTEYTSETLTDAIDMEVEMR